MEEILIKYKDSNGYVFDIENLYVELKNNNFSIDDIISILNKVQINNKNIFRKIIFINEKEKNVIKQREKVCYKDYIKVLGKQKKEHNTDSKKYNINLDFYMKYINEHLEDDFCDILPKNYSNDSLVIIDTILTVYIKEINFFKYNLLHEKDESNIIYIQNEIIKNEYIFNKIKNYKMSLIELNDKYSKNDIVYFMDRGIPNVFKDIDNDLEIKKSILRLIESIEYGVFNNIKSFTNNNKLKGIFEVRDLSKRTRVLFELVGEGKYSIICSICNKTDSNSKYKEYINNQIKKYRNSTSNNIKSIDNIKKLVLGDNNG